MPRLPALLSFTLVAVGCPPPSSLRPDALTSAGTPGSTGGDEGSTGDEAGSTGSTSSTGATVTGEIEETTGASSTTDGPVMLGPPRVVEAWWTPDAPMTPGTVTLTIETKDVEWLELKYDGMPLELKQSKLEPWIYTLDVEVISELFEGTHTAVIRPFRGQDEGDTVEVSFVADLPAHGSEGFWEAGAGLGQGLAGTVLPGLKDDVYEFGTLKPGGQRRCYLRRRRADGLAPIKDVVEIQPGNLCTATDAAIESDGRLLLLYEYEKAGVTQWQLDRHDPWNETLEPVLVGAKNHKGNAVAVGPDGEIVVCGSRPGGPTDTDLAAWIVGVNNPITLDLVYGPNSHWISEVAHDCAFVGPTLVLAGDADGLHGEDLMSSRRHMVTEVDLITRDAVWTVVPPAGKLVESSAQAIAAAGDDRYVVAGHVCDDNCFPQQLELREYALGGVVLSSFRPAVKTTPATGIAWHPAGYAVVSAGELVSPAEMKFWAQGWIPGEQKDLWTYSRSDGEGIHWALDVAVGKAYWIYLVGVVDFGGPLPVFTILFP